MPTQSEAVEAVGRSLAALPPGRWVLAVSGGRDSMVLLDAMARFQPTAIAAVASFDHGTGPAAKRAVALVERSALARELPVVTGRMAPGADHDEASWRAARWRFLRGWAEEHQAGILTAHTWDDQVETVVLRLLRGAGPRGLAGMRAEPIVRGPRIARPFLPLRRADIAAYATSQRLEWVEDPSNDSLAFARNRVRHEILPALERAAPGFSAWCWAISGHAAAWRRELAAWVDASLAPLHPDRDSVAVPAPAMQRLDDAAAGIVWPEVAARIGLALDRRGIARLREWAPTAKTGGRVQLSGGADVQRTASTFVMRRLY